MGFTEKSTINEIINYPGIDRYLTMLFPKTFINLVPESLRDSPLDEVEKQIHMPWGPPYLSEELVRSANTVLGILGGDSYRICPLWFNEKAVDTLDFSKESKRKVCLIEWTFPDKNMRPAVIICPGGGYSTLAGTEEGIHLAERMAEIGYRPFVLFYRVAPERYPAPQLDLMLAIKYIRANEQKLGVDKNDVMVMGSSAGGHVCAVSAALYKELEPELMRELRADMHPYADFYEDVCVRPDKVCLNYPRTSYMNRKQCESFVHLTGGDESLRYKLSVENMITKDYPKTFLWMCEDDEQLGLDNVTEMAKALDEQGVEYQLKLYPDGGHGCCNKKGVSAERWIEEMLQFMWQ